MKHLAKITLITIMTVLFALPLTGCGEDDRNAAQAVDPALADAISELTPSAVPTDTSRTLQIERTVVLPTPVSTPEGTVSIAEAPTLDVKITPTPTPTPKGKDDDDDDDDEDEEEEKDPNLTGNGTPLVFEVADCSVVAMGEIDKKMSDEILAAINVYRERGNLEPLEANMSLEFCADCRSKEISCLFGHMRPNNTYWWIVCPAYFKAELLAKDYGTAQQTVDAWMSTATGRQYLLSPDLLSIGISTFHNNGRNYIVAALGD